MTWRLAGSLIKLRQQINETYPNRNKASDGTIGDAAHAREVSDHNPDDNGVVTAFDITHDPANGVDIDKLSDRLFESRDPRIKYLVANGLICVPSDYGWQWIEYSGPDPHTSHLHVSVYGNYDDQSGWNIGNKEEDMSKLQLTKEEVQEIHQLAFDDERPPVSVEDAWTSKELGEYLRFLHQGGTWATRQQERKNLAEKVSQLEKSNSDEDVKDLIAAVKLLLERSK